LYILDYFGGYTYNCIIKKRTIMGQTKRLLDEIWELENDITNYPDDLDRDYEMWVAQKEQEQLEAEYAAYEEMLSDTK